jgi:hypothetical protein
MYCEKNKRFVAKKLIGEDEDEGVKKAVPSELRGLSIKELKAMCVVKGVPKRKTKLGCFQEILKNDCTLVELKGLCNDAGMGCEGGVEIR